MGREHVPYLRRPVSETSRQWRRELEPLPRQRYQGVAKQWLGLRARC